MLLTTYIINYNVISILYDNLIKCLIKYKINTKKPIF
jgi:hypothetical protein